MNDHPVLGRMHWPDLSKLGVVQWSMTDDDTFVSTVATLQRTDDAIRARVVSRDMDGQQRSLFCAVWSDSATATTLTYHRLHDQDQPLDMKVAMATFQHYVNTIGQRPRFTYAGDASTGVAPAAEATPVPAPRTLRF